MTKINHSQCPIAYLYYQFGIGSLLRFFIGLRNTDIAQRTPQKVTQPAKKPKNPPPTSPRAPLSRILESSSAQITALSSPAVAPMRLPNVPAPNIITRPTITYISEQTRDQFKEPFIVCLTSIARGNSCIESNDPTQTGLLNSHCVVIVSQRAAIQLSRSQIDHIPFLFLANGFDFGVIMLHMVLQCLQRTILAFASLSLALQILSKLFLGRQLPVAAFRPLVLGRTRSAATPAQLVALAALQSVSEGPYFFMAVIKFPLEFLDVDPGVVQVPILMKNVNLSYIVAIKRHLVHRIVQLFLLAPQTHLLKVSSSQKTLNQVSSVYTRYKNRKSFRSNSMTLTLKSRSFGKVGSGKKQKWNVTGKAIGG